MTSNADRVIEVYHRHGTDWARDRGDRLIEGAWLDRFQALLPNQASVLDLGCGSGRPIARSLIERGCKLTGVDAVPAMIALCQQDCPSGDWHLADMRTLSLGRTFNGLIAWDSFWHLSPDDQRRAMAVFRAHAGPHAALMLTSGRTYGESVGALGGEPLYHASLGETEYRALLDSHGFDVVAHETDDPVCNLHTVWLALLRR